MLDFGALCEITCCGRYGSSKSTCYPHPADLFLYDASALIDKYDLLDAIKLREVESEVGITISHGSNMNHPMSERNATLRLHSRMHARI